MALRSSAWYAGEDRNAYIHRAWMRRGVPGDAFDGRPQIAIANTASDLTPCNAHLDEVAGSVRDGVLEAEGGADHDDLLSRFDVGGGRFQTLDLPIGPQQGQILALADLDDGGRHLVLAGSQRARWTASSGTA